MKPPHCHNMTFVSGFSDRAETIFQYQVMDTELTDVFPQVLRQQSHCSAVCGLNLTTDK